MTHYWQVVAEFQNAETIVLSSFQFHSSAMELVQAITKNNVGWYRKTDNESVNLSQAIRLKIVGPKIVEVLE